MPHDDRIRQLSDLFLADLRGPIEASLRQILDQLMAIASDDHNAALSDAIEKATADHDAARQAALEQAHKEHEAALEAVKEEHGKALAAVRAELEEQHRQAMASARDEASAARDAAVAAAVGSLRDELVGDHESAMYAVHEGIESERQSLTDERSTLEAALDAAKQERDGARQECDAARQERDDARRERDAARSSAAELADQLAAARAQQEQMTELAHAEAAASAEAASAAPAGESDEARAEERQWELACSERLLAGIRDLDASRSLTEVLAVLTTHAASEAARTAVLILQNGRLRGWSATGMGAVSAHAIDLPLSGIGVLGRAVATACAASTSDASDLPTDNLPSFLLPPRGRVGLALPVLVGGRVVAIVYADDAGESRATVPSHWPEALELLARHAGCCLEVLTLSRASGVGARQRTRETEPVPALPAAGDAEREEESARRHARLLISEIKLYNEPLVEQGRRDGNLLELLGAEIERARRLYEEKIPAAVRERVDCFDEEIVRTLAGGDRALLGQTT